MRLETIDSLTMLITSSITLGELTKCKIDTMHYNELSDEVAMVRIRPIVLMVDNLIANFYSKSTSQARKDMQQDLSAVGRQLIANIQRLIDAPSALDEWVLMRVK